MRINANFLQNNPAFRMANAQAGQANKGQGVLGKKLNAIVDQGKDQEQKDPLSPELKEKLAGLAKAERSGGRSISEGSLVNAIKKETEYLNSLGKSHAEQMENLNKQHQENLEKEKTYQSMLAGKTSMDAFKEAAMSKEEYEKNPQISTSQSLDGTVTKQEVSYDMYQSLWDTEQTQLAREKVSAALERTQKSINDYPDIIKTAQKMNEFRVRASQARLASLQESLNKKRAGIDVKVKDETLWESFQKTFAKELEEGDEETIKDLMEGIERMKEEDPENKDIYEKMGNYLSNWKDKHLNVRA